MRKIFARLGRMPQFAALRHRGFRLLWIASLLSSTAHWADVVVIGWLTGFDESALSRHLAQQTTFEDFFADAQLNSNAALITGVVCGVRVEAVEDPLMQKIRYLDKLVDELARGTALEKVLRGA